MQSEIERSDYGREKLMKTIWQNIQTDPNLGEELLSPRLRRNLDMLMGTFPEAATVSRDALGDRQDLIAIRNKKQSILERVIRHFWTALENRTDRLGHSPKVMRLYRPTGEAGRPSLNTSRDVLMAAENLVKGEEKAVAQGFPAVTNPEISEIQTELSKFEALVLAKEQADLALARTQNHLQKQRSQVETLLRHIVSQAKQAMEDKPVSYTRRVLRNLGIGFGPPGRQRQRHDHFP